jgi:hypothetical protein
VVTGADLRGDPVTVRGDGELARCLQHETGHLHGELYIDLLAARGLATRQTKLTWETGLVVMFRLSGDVSSQNLDAIGPLLAQRGRRAAAQARHCIALPLRLGYEHRIFRQDREPVVHPFGIGRVLPVRKEPCGVGERQPAFDLVDL